jgi:hypothetical protein
LVTVLVSTSSTSNGVSGIGFRQRCSSFRNTSDGTLLLRRVFAQDVLPCACGGRRAVVAFVTDANLTRSLLTSLGLPAEPATFAPARAPPQADLAWYDPA